MSLKKKGTPEKLKIVKKTDLEKFMKLIEEATRNEDVTFVLATKKTKKHKK